MKVCVCFVLFFTYSLAEHESDIFGAIPRLSYIDLIIKNIENEKWEQNETVCYNQILSTLHNAKNLTLWATWILDSIQFPTGVLYGSKYHLGNYDECMKPLWLHSHPQLRTKYCLADVTLSDSSLQKTGSLEPYGSAKLYINSITKHARKLNTITWGVCVPTSCGGRSVSKFLKILLRISLLGTFSKPMINVDECQVAGEYKEYGIGVYVFWYLLISLLAIAVLSTWYLSNTDHAATESMVTKLAACFCMNRNAYDLVKFSSEDMPVLHGMRALTAIILVFTHQVFFLNSGAVGNGLDVDKDLDMGFFVLHTDLFTDTFLLMSGLLLAKGLVAKAKLENPLMVLWKRYIRLIGPMALIVFYMAVVSIHSSEGPLWQRLAGREQKTCENSWWLSLMMLNNYINSEEMCYIILWYIPTDYHLTILGVGLIYLCRGHRRLGKTAVGLVALLAVFLPAWTTYWNRLPATMIYNVETMIDIRQNRVFNSTYIRSHYRIGSYLVGLAVGYLMTVYKPSLHRNTISKKWSFLLFLVMFALAWVPMSLGGVFYTRTYDAMEAALYAATNRLVWAAALSAIIYLCEYGDIPIVSSVLCCPAWRAPSRLSYGVYLAHPALLFHNLYSARAPLREQPFVMLSDSFGPIVIGYLLSLLIWLLIQAPIINLTNILHSKKKPVQKMTLEDHAIMSNLAETENTTKNKIL